MTRNARGHLQCGVADALVRALALEDHRHLLFLAPGVPELGEGIDGLAVRHEGLIARDRFTPLDAARHDETLHDQVGHSGRRLHRLAVLRCYRAQHRGLVLFGLWRDHLGRSRRRDGCGGSSRAGDDARHRFRALLAFGAASERRDGRRKRQHRNGDRTDCQPARFILTHRTVLSSAASGFAGLGPG
jgi:hypothetical protein